MTLIVPPWAQPSSCYSLLTKAPEIEPITVEDAKLRGGVDWSPNDPRETLVPKLIAAARSMVERDTGLALLTQERDIYFRSPDEAGPIGFPLPSLATPLQAITEVEPFVPASGWPQPGPVQWRLSGRVGQPAWLTVEPATPIYGMRVHVIAGWPSVEALEADAPLLVHAVGLLVGHMLTLGRDLAITGAVAAISEVPEGYDDCIAPHRLIWVA